MAPFLPELTAADVHIWRLALERDAAALEPLHETLSADERTRAERFVPYCAYVPDSPSPITTRGESANFLHDVVVTLERAGFPEGRSVPGFDRQNMQERFLQQIQALSADFRATGTSRGPPTLPSAEARPTPGHARWPVPLLK